MHQTRKDQEFQAIARMIAVLYDERKKSKDLPEPWFKHLISSLISAATELTADSRGKIKRRKVLGQPYWSKKAIQRVRQNLKEKTIQPEKGLQHEHVIPKTHYFEKFEKIESPTQKNIQRLLETTVAAIVTADEHKRLPESYSGNKRWERYKGRSIIFDLSDYKTRKEQLKLFKSKTFQLKTLQKINLSK